MSDIPESLEIRSADSSRKFQWMCILAKEPEIAQLVFELSELGAEEKKLITKILSNINDTIQLYCISKERTIRKSVQVQQSHLETTSPSVSDYTQKINKEFDTIMEVFSV